MGTIRRYGMMVAAVALMATTTNIAQAQDNQPSNQQVMQELESLKAKVQDVDAMKSRIIELQKQIEANSANAEAAKAQADQAKKAVDVQAAASSETATVMRKLSKGQLQIGRTNVFFNGWLETSAGYREHNTLSGPSQTPVLSPYPIQAQYSDTEFRMGPPQTRLGANSVSDLSHNLILRSKFEIDMLAGNNAANVANGSSYGIRVRHAWAEIDNVKYGWHIVLGQAYSLSLPNGNLVGADGSQSANLGWTLLPGTEVTTQPDDGAFLGLGSTRNMQIRLVKEIAKHAAVAVSFENNTVNWGGDHGTAIGTGVLGKPIVSNASYSTSTNEPFVSFGVMPDIIAKIGYDPTTRFHFEAWGIFRQYKDRANVATIVSSTGVSTAAPRTPGVGEAYAGGGALGTYIKLIPKKLDFHAGLGDGSFQSQIDGAIPDVTYDSTGKPVPIYEQYAFAELIAHPNHNLDIYLQGGSERGFRAGVSGTSSATAYGYGNAYGNNGATGNKPCTTLSATSLTATCVADTNVVWNFAITPWWRIINDGKHGHLDFIPEVEFVGRKVFKDQFGYAPHTSNVAFDICFRYWPF